MKETNITLYIKFCLQSCQCTFNFGLNLEIGRTASLEKVGSFRLVHHTIIYVSSFTTTAVCYSGSAYCIKTECLGQWFEPCGLCFLFISSLFFLFYFIIIIIIIVTIIILITIIIIINLFCIFNYDFPLFFLVVIGFDVYAG